MHVAQWYRFQTDSGHVCFMQCASCVFACVRVRAVQEDPDVLCDDLSALIDTAHARGPLGPEDNARLHDLTLRFYACTNFMLHPSSILLQRFPHVSQPTLQNPYPVVCGTNIVAELSCHPGAAHARSSLVGVE